MNLPSPYPSCLPSLYLTHYRSPLGELSLVASDAGLCGLYLAGQKHWPADSLEWLADKGQRFHRVVDWLDAYFAKIPLPDLPPLDFVRGTAFQQTVWRTLQDIPPGQTLSYGQLAERMGRPKAVRAVGAAVGRNPLSIVVPCHRVIGSNGSLAGYAGGLERKIWLLKHEARADQSSL
jgi:methylated-DNA-[protein]-cysteine S-methyltransferase